jgi:hypothetical protein
MKKTLIALAVLAASGASFAQVSITGNATYGYQVISAPGSTNGGFGIDGSSVTFASTEDLGGGNTVKASLVLDKTNRSGTGGGDFGLNIAGAWGAIDMSLAEGSDYLSGAFVGLDGKVFGSLGPATDGVSYKTPAIIPGLTFSLSHSEAENAFGAGAAGNVANTQRNNTVTAAYAAGPLSVNVGFRSYDNQDVGNKTRVRGKASYDFGMFALGAGFVETQKQTGTETLTNVGVSAPFGAFSLAADYGWNKNVAGSTRSGYGIVGTYNLSKRTSVATKYYNYLAALGDSSNTTRTDVVLSHNF